MLKHNIILFQKDRKGELLFGMQYVKSISVNQVCNITQNFFCGKEQQHADIIQLLSFSAHRHWHIKNTIFHLFVILKIIIKLLFQQ